MFFPSHKKSSGFTLIEILVVVGIFAILSATIFLRQSAFDSSVNLTNLAYSVALSVREAQVYGTSVRGETGAFTTSYGIYVEESSPQTYYLFHDLNDDNRFTMNEAVETFSLGKGNEISDICTNGNCSNTDAATILFTRPNLEARMYRCNAGTCHTNASQERSEASINLVSPRGNTRTIKVFVNGQMTIEGS